MNEYQIKYSLLVPKMLLLRLDILPFLIAYSILAYCFLTFEDSGNTYIYMRLTFVGLGFLNCTSHNYFRSYLYFRALVQESTGSNPVQLNQGRHGQKFEQSQSHLCTIKNTWLCVEPWHLRSLRFQLRVDQIINIFLLLPTAQVLLL